MASPQGLRVGWGSASKMDWAAAFSVDDGMHSVDFNLHQDSARDMPPFFLHRPATVLDAGAPVLSLESCKSQVLQCN